MKKTYIVSGVYLRRTSEGTMNIVLTMTSIHAESEDAAVGIFVKMKSKEFPEHELFRFLVMDAEAQVMRTPIVEEGAAA